MWPTLVAAAATHLVWGTQPVLTRFLQTRTELGKSAVICGTQLLSCGIAQATMLCRRPVAAAAKGGSRFDQNWWLVAAAYGSVTALRVVTNFVSAGLTSAWHVSAAATFGPFFTAAISKVVLGESLDARAWPSLCVAVAGAAVVASGEGDGGLGVLVQIISMIFSGSARTMIKWTEVGYSSICLMRIQYVTVIAITLVWTLLSSSLLSPSGTVYFTTTTTSSALLTWDAMVAAFVLSFGVQWAAAEAQVILIRRLGPALYTCFQPLRLVSTVVVGALVLRERVVGLPQWLGLAVVVSAVLTFLLRRVLWPRRGENPAPGASSASGSGKEEQRYSQRDGEDAATTTKSQQLYVVVPARDDEHSDEDEEPQRRRVDGILSSDDDDDAAADVFLIMKE
mmetsp:Transcript_12586/g.41245  ORF Transcript_12586/g.41245 Transcript_12586/m.41245 type:complete len:395 (+) Transcript_12586:33-1217(+)